MFNRRPYYNRNTHPRVGYNQMVSAGQQTRYRRTNPVATKTYSADQVFGAAVAAQEANGDYVKYAKQDPETGAVLVKPNKELMREFLETQLTPEQIARGREVREHYHRLLFQQLAGELKDFLASALRVSSRAEFGNTDWLDLAIVAALPSCCYRDQKREAAQTQREQIAENSQPVGQPGDRVSGDFTVVQCSWSRKWNLWTVNAQHNGNLFFMFLKQEVQPGTVIHVTGTVKHHRDGNVTQLCRVRVK